MYYVPVLLPIPKDPLNLTIPIYSSTVCFDGLLIKRIFSRIVALSRILTNATGKNTSDFNVGHLPSVVASTVEVPAKVVVSKAAVVAVDATPGIIIIITK